MVFLGSSVCPVVALQPNYFPIEMFVVAVNFHFERFIVFKPSAYQGGLSIFFGQGPAQAGRRKRTDTEPSQQRQHKMYNRFFHIPLQKYGFVPRAARVKHQERAKNC
jgi:hypothetical protein